MPFLPERPRIPARMGTEAMPHLIKSVIPLPNAELQVHFRNSFTKRCDMKPLIEEIDLYRHFLSDPKVFNQVRVSEDGYAVVWNEYVDYGCEALWQSGKDAKSPFDNLLSCGDAALLWKLDESTLRKAILDGRFKVGSDAMKFGKQWVVTFKAMIRLFGDPRKKL